MQIFFSPFSPFVRKCLVVGHELGLDDKITLLPSNAHPVDRSQELIKINPLGKVPTFYTDDGRALYDSRVICEYLNTIGKGQLFPSDLDARWEALTLQALGDGILEACLLARYENVARPEAYRWSAWEAAQLDKVATSLDYLNNEISLLTGRLDIGSLTIACALWYLDLRFPDYGWRTRFTAVAEWAAEFTQRPSLSKAWAL